MLGAEMDLQLVENSVIAMENILKAWLHDQTGQREHLQLLLPASVQTNSPKPIPAHRPDLGDSQYTYTLFLETLKEIQNVYVGTEVNKCVDVCVCGGGL